MPAWLLPALLTAASTAGSLFGGRGRSNQYRNLMNMWSPKAILGDANQLYGGMVQSPMFSAAQQDILGAGRRAEQSISRAGAGVTSGMDLLQQAAGAGVTGTGLSQLHSGLFRDALAAAQQSASQRMGLGASMLNQPTSFERTFGSLLGAAGPLLQQWMMMKAMQPRMGGGGNAGYMGQPGWQYYVGGQQR